MKTLRPIRSAPLILAAILICGAAAQQVPSNQSGLIAVTVTDPLHRFVTGLDRENFAVLENGVARPITYFSPNSAISVAILSESPIAAAKLEGPDDELIQTASLPDALRQLAASNNARKAIVQTTAATLEGVPAGIQVIRIGAGNVQKALVELQNQYLLRYETSSQAAQVEVVLKAPRGLPPLKPIWQAAF